MKALLVAFVAAATATAEAVTLVPGTTDVVIDRKAPPAVRFAADELTNVLSQAFGQAVPIVNEPSPGRVSLILGENRWSREAGIVLKDKPYDTFVVKASGDRIHLLGQDHPSARIETDLFKPRATTFAVYAFLEDYAGVRFYFPGELGTVIPRCAAIEVPDTDRAVTPDFLVREWYNGPRAFWFGETSRTPFGNRMRNLNWLRLRMGTRKLPLCHGTRNYKLAERFAKAHPEYFALKTNGTRSFDPTVWNNPQLCWTSGIVDELYADVKAAFTGGKPSDRGIPLKYWPSGIDVVHKVADVMPQDGQEECRCAACQKLYRAGTDPVWKATARMAQRLIDEGVAGSLTQMAYGHGKRPPDYPLPTNILVQVAVRGQWSMAQPEKVAKETALIDSWVRKLGHPVWLWTYPGKHRSIGPNFDGIPQLSMHCWGEYYARVRDRVIGGFSESESDRYSFNYLNHYVYSRVCWNAATDIDAVLDEHYRLMFGAGAEEMKALYSVLERKWTTQLVGESRDTPSGPQATVPSWDRIAAAIYPPEEIAKLDALVASALGKVAPDSLEARRIRLIADEYVGGIRKAIADHLKRRKAVASFRAKVSRDASVELRGFGDEKPAKPVGARCTAWIEGDDLHVRYDCDEPAIDRVAQKMRRHDDPDLWTDNSVDLYFCPNGDRSTAYHVIANSLGVLYDSRMVFFGDSTLRGGFTSDLAWGDGQVTARVEKGKDRWSVEIAVPGPAVGGFVREMPMFFGRTRVVDGPEGMGIYGWGPAEVRSFLDTSNYGTVVIE